MSTMTRPVFLSSSTMDAPPVPPSEMNWTSHVERRYRQPSLPGIWIGMRYRRDMGVRDRNRLLPDQSLRSHPVESDSARRHNVVLTAKSPSLD
jgi:hypothetical protein